ncbi:MAG: phospho-N-acetylmuramoyl-pentapeptide-transferase [Proteobacteria bacterium]|nr:phospho-N-acetylmuramoyl-pentapeptide-transferase [Pseudomonadota bacterium]
MLYNLLSPLADDAQFFNLFRYLTFRTGGATLTALIICFLLGPHLIDWLKRKHADGQPIRSDGPETHFKKKGTPTMGGLMILLSVTLSTILWADITNSYVWYSLLIMIGFGLIGFIDDYKKLTKKNVLGLAGRKKLFAQIGLSAAVAAGIMFSLPDGLYDTIAIPFFKDVLLDVGVLFLPFAVLVITGASNAVNLTDGLDGLAIVPVAIAAACFGLISYVVGNAIYSGYLQLHYVPGSGELAVLCGALIGGAMGFLWYNAPPAMVFMGDTGSLSLGGVLGAIAVITKHELVLAIIGGLFVMETVSVMIQVAYFKMTGKRVFLMAPLHHHFEKLGWSEPTIVIRFWIIAVVLALIGLSTLKLR